MLLAILFIFEPASRAMLCSLARKIPYIPIPNYVLLLIAISSFLVWLFVPTTSSSYTLCVLSKLCSFSFIALALVSTKEATIIAKEPIYENLQDMCSLHIIEKEFLDDNIRIQCHRYRLWTKICLYTSYVYATIYHSRYASINQMSRDIVFRLVVQALCAAARNGIYENWISKEALTIYVNKIQPTISYLGDIEYLSYFAVAPQVLTWLSLSHTKHNYVSYKFRLETGIQVHYIESEPHISGDIEEKYKQSLETCSRLISLDLQHSTNS